MLQDNWFGNGLPDLHYELIGSAKIHSLHRVDEAGLFPSKWAEYVTWHPVRSTYFFSHLYCVQTRVWVERNFDLVGAGKYDAFKGEDIFQSSEATSMWLARQAADRAGIPYPFVMDYASQRFRDRQFHSFGRPNQLYGEEFEIDCLAAWKERVSRGLVYSRDPGTCQTLQHESMVVKQILDRPRPHYNLLGRMFREGVLLPERMGQTFGPDTVARAQDVARRLASQSALTVPL